LSKVQDINLKEIVMKNLIYVLTLLFNAFGFLFSISFLFYTKLDNALFLQIIFIACLIFALGFCITLTDFVHDKFFTKQRKRAYYAICSEHKPVVLDYKDYFISRKSDFIIK